jgi:hypothetical protein
MAYTKPGLRERIKDKIMNENVAGTKSGQWSARKSQLLKKRYEEAGGGYRGGKTKAQKSLSKWTKQDWQTKSGKPSSKTGERYLPKKAIENLSSEEYARTTAAKRKGKGKGEQFVKQPESIAKKTKRYRT